MPIVMKLHPPECIHVVQRQVDAAELRAGLHVQVDLLVGAHVEVGHVHGRLEDGPGQGVGLGRGLRLTRARPVRERLRAD